MSEQNEKASFEELRKILYLLSLGYKVPDIVYDVVKKVAIEEIEKKKRPVLLKRDPDIHRRRIQAAYVKIIDGETIEIPPPICGGFGADFDGDSIFSNIRVYLTDDIKSNNYMSFHIKDFIYYFPLEFIQYKKVNCTVKYVFSFLSDEYGQDIYVPCLDLTSGTVVPAKIKEFSIHENIDMWHLISYKYGILDLCVSSDHSLVVFDKNNNMYRRESICNFENIKDSCSLVKFSVQDSTNENREIVLEYLDLSDFELRRSNIDIGFDLTIENPLTGSTGTFITDEGVFVFDTMAVFALLTKESQEEAKKQLMTIYNSNKLNAPNFELTNEIVLGVYIATSSVNSTDEKPITNVNLKDLIKLHPSTKVEMKLKGKTIISTAGRIYFNSMLPDWFPFIDQEVDKKKLNSILQKIIEKSPNEYLNVLNNVMKLGFYYATLYPRAISLDIFTLPKKILKLKEKLMKEKNVFKQIEIINEMEKELKEYIKEKVPELRDIVFSGSSKDISQLRQMMVAKGLFTDPEGKLLNPVYKSLIDGYEPEDFFNASSGARKGLISKVKFTSKGGYAYRKMIYLMGNVFLSKNVRDCNTKMFAKIKLTEDLYSRLKGRYIQNEQGGKLYPVTEEYVGKIISLRSPIFCKSLDICRVCYGDLYKQINTRMIGILAAQECTSLSERIMKSFHMGGVSNYKYASIIECLKENMEKDFYEKIENTFFVENFSLYSTSDIKIIIDKDLFKKNNYEIKKVENNIILPLGYFDIKLDDINIPVNIEDETIIHVKDSYGIEESENSIFIIVPKKEPILTVYPKDMSPEKVALLLDNYVSGNTLWRSPESLLLKMYKVLGDFGDWDLVHLEVIVSNIMRWKNDPRLPARVKYPYEPALYSIKNLPSIMSWPLGIAYEDFDKAITFGIISEKGISSPIEKLMFNEPLSE